MIYLGDNEVFLDRLKKKETSAYEKLLQYCFDTASLFGIEGRRNADDIAMNSIVRILEHLNHYDSERSQLKTWIGAIIKREAKKLYHSAKKDRTLKSRLNIERGKIYTEEAGKRIEQKEYLDGLLEKLEEEERSALIDAHAREIPRRVMAEDTGRTEMAVKLRVWKIRRELREAARSEVSKSFRN